MTTKTFNEDSAERALSGNSCLQTQTEEATWMSSNTFPPTIQPLDNLTWMSENLH